MFRRIPFSVFRITAVVVAVFGLLWWFGVRMPGKNVKTAAALSRDETFLQEQLLADVNTLAGKLGERNLAHYELLEESANFIEQSFVDTGLRPRRDTYEVNGRACHNIEAEISGATPRIVLIGAHYDSILGGPGANDNASGVAALLALARHFAGVPLSAGHIGEPPPARPVSTLRFVAFVNEEPPYFQTSRMGSFVYASRCKARHDQIAAMISLETIGYFSDAPNSQSYPAPGLGIFYPTTGNFIGFVGNLRSRSLLRRALSTFRAQEKIPSEGAALPGFIPGVSWSDQWSFWKHGYPAIMVTDTALFRYPHYHLSTDTSDKLDYQRFALVVSGMEKVIIDLASD